MKYIVLIGDGMADHPMSELGGKTPLAVSRTPNMDELAKMGALGTARTIPSGFQPASDVANLSILGYDPKRYYTGRGPLEAADMGITLDSGDVAFRCNLVTIAEEKMVDYSAGHIASKEADAIIKDLDKALGGSKLKFHTGTSYRHLAIFKDPAIEKDLLETKCTPPHDISGQNAMKYLPKGKGADILNRIMDAAKPILEEHDVNHVRIDLKENPANSIWLWGQGGSCAMPSFKELYGIDGSIISAVNLVNGIGRLIGLDVIKVPGATGYYDTNFAGKAEYAINSLKKKDFVYVHVEAPDEASHNGDMREKMRAIENFDNYIVGGVLKEFKDKGGYRILVLPDHYTPLSIKTHTEEPIPFIMAGDGIEPDSSAVFTEDEAKKGGMKFDRAHELLGALIKG
ncbi:MAG: cofactor-independent phosphoglycerate mutase [Candidatus Omnitrophica bacterium CG1_02_49_10]|nr:MAG: cofactor-independent phosphoglycerate mutase [Candidatus Omnitrophica bacterium CG1_02_49_10]